MTDSPRWCETCKAYGSHHTDRHEEHTKASEWTAEREQIGRALGKVLALLEGNDYSTIAETEDGHPIALPEIVDVVEKLMFEVALEETQEQYREALDELSGVPHINRGNYGGAL